MPIDSDPRWVLRFWLDRYAIPEFENIGYSYSIALFHWLELHHKLQRLLRTVFLNYIYKILSAHPIYSLNRNQHPGLLAPDNPHSHVLPIS